MEKKPHVTAVIVAAGSGTRMGTVSKPMIKLGGKTVLERVTDAFCASAPVDDIVVVCRDTDISAFSSLPKPAKPVKFVCGGNTRSDSVANGVAATKNADFVCIHDCARPFITGEDITAVITEAFRTNAASACTAVTDTIKYSSKEEHCFYTPKRENLISVGTPQVFRRDVYTVSRAKAKHDNFVSTDETSIAEHAGFTVSYVSVTPLNIKLTTPEDVKIAKAICFLQERGTL